MGIDKKVKVCIIGDPAVGKSSLVRRFVLDQFDDYYLMTIGAKVMKKAVPVTDSKGEIDSVTLMVWDLMGQKNYKIIESTVFAHVKAALVVADLSRPETITNLTYWVNALFDICGEIPIIFLGNKEDLVPAEGPNIKQINDVGEALSVPVVHTSAKTGNHVEQAFSDLAQKLID